MSTFYIPVVLNPGTLEAKAIVIRQPAADRDSAAMLTRRRYPRGRVYAARDRMPPAADLAALVADNRSGGRDARREQRKHEMRAASRELREQYRARV